MTAVRRSLVMTVLVLAVLVAGVLPAWASFTTKASGGGVPVATGIVAPPTDLVVTSSCWTTTTTTKRTTTTDPVTGQQTTTERTTTSTPARSNRNVESSTTSAPAPGPGPNDSTTTTVTKDTELRIASSWTPSTTARGVNGYLGSLHFWGSGGLPVSWTWPWVTTMNGGYDAGMLWMQLQFSVTTLTEYGWSARSELSQVLTC
ncbi:hypothetical protein [Geodermatophilus sp. DSM 44513]|uniref:hypothetical protein n=1 Tax=Geodermatophilus sp. DSM 44513 TaxID=1528104 RepID=UPI0012825806|nr:hypothetical protein [Geodermatophilus sp. DSM 44513]WNV76723.1 hypothetical protein RTG05_05470 [Geodermatophilus sp. DSM 44513]